MTVERLDAPAPTFFAEGPAPAMAGLMFRVGVGDERPAWRGVTHLVEHLALYAIGAREHDFNGVVDHLTCAFYASGSMAEVEGFLTDVVSSLGALPLDRLETEKQVLARESAIEGGDLIGRLLAHRFGTLGFGVAVTPEFGLGWLGPAEVERWRAGRFVAGNAALWLHGPRPPAIDLPLPAGNLVPPPPATALPGLNLPAWTAEGTGGLAVSGVGARAAATVAALRLLSDELHERLRVQRGAVYDVWSEDLALGPERAHVALGAACRDEDAHALATEVLEALRRLADDGPSEARLDRVRRQLERGRAEHPEPEKAELHRESLDTLLGAPGMLAQETAELRVLTAGDVARAAREILDEALVLTPEGTDRAPAGLPALERAPHAPIGGRRFAARRRGGGELRVGHEGVAWDALDEHVTIPAAEVAVVLRDGPHAYTVVGADGIGVAIDLGELGEPDAARAAIEALTPDPPVRSLDERPDRVRRLADAQLRRRWAVTEELALLPDVLYDDEEPLLLAQASHGMKLGLLVLTDLRLLFVYAGARKEVLLRIPRDRVRGARVRRRALGRRLVVEVDDQRLEFGDIAPKERLRELVDGLA